MSFLRDPARLSSAAGRGGTGLPDGAEASKGQPALVRAERGALGMLLGFSFFSLGSLALLVFGGRHQPDRQGNPQDLLTLFLAWMIGSAWVGATVGLASPWMRRFPVAAAIGPIAVLPLMVGFLAADANGFSHWTGHQTMLAVVISLVVGVIFGVGCWRRVRDVPSAPATPSDRE
jgi:hypothetical protein